MFSVLLAILGIFISFIPPVDPDLGWHLKYAEYFVNNHKLLVDNIYSYTMTEYVWHNSYWVSQLIIYLSHHYLGSILAGLIFSIILALVVLKFIKDKTQNTSGIFFTYMIVMVTLSATITTVRPLYFDIFFWLYLLQTLYYKNPRQHKWLKEEYIPIIFMLWANFHAEHLIGLFAYGVYFLFEAIQNFRNKELKKSAKTFWILTISGLSTFINPYGINLLLTLLKEITQPYTAHASEWTSPIFTNQIALLPAIFLFPLSFKYLKSKNTIWYGALLLFFVLFALRAIYMSRILVILAIPALIDFFNKLDQKIIQYHKQAVKIILYIMLPLYMLIFAQNISLAMATKNWSEFWHYPYDIVQILKAREDKPNIFNWYRWGGYLIWQLPEYKTFVDGRMSAWRKEDGGYFVQDYTKIHANPEDNVELVNYYLDKYQIKLSIDSPESPMTKYLLKNGWVTVYENEYSILLERKDVSTNR